MNGVLYGNLSRRPWNQFHLQQNTTVERLRLILTLGWEDASQSFGDLGTTDLIRGFLRGLDILNEDGSSTEFGLRLSNLEKIKPELICPAIHAWLRCHGMNGYSPRFALAYDSLCNLLYSQVTDKGSTKISRDDLLSECRVVLRGRSGLNDSKIAFSLDSIRGASYWLGGLPGNPVRTVHTDYEVTLRSAVALEEIFWVRGFFATHQHLPKNHEPVAEFLARMLFSTSDAVIQTLRKLYPSIVAKNTNTFLESSELPTVAIGALP